MATKESSAIYLTTANQRFRFLDSDVFEQIKEAVRGKTELCSVFINNIRVPTLIVKRAYFDLNQPAYSQVWQPEEAPPIIEPVKVDGNTTETQPFFWSHRNKDPAREFNTYHGAMAFDKFAAKNHE